MSIESLLKAKHQELLNKLIKKATVYNYWHINIPINDLRNIVNEIEEIEKELMGK